jgi:hypothetical protein
MHRYGDIVPTDNVSQTYTYMSTMDFFFFFFAIALRFMFGVTVGIHPQCFIPPSTPSFCFFHLIYKYVHIKISRAVTCIFVIVGVLLVAASFAELIFHMLVTHRDQVDSFAMMMMMMIFYSYIYLYGISSISISLSLRVLYL